MVTLSCTIIIIWWYLSTRDNETVRNFDVIAGKAKPSLEAKRQTTNDELLVLFCTFFCNKYFYIFFLFCEPQIFFIKNYYIFAYKIFLYIESNLIQNDIILIKLYACHWNLKLINKFEYDTLEGRIHIQIVVTRERVQLESST